VTAVGLINRFWQETTGDRMAWTADTRRDYVRPSGTYASDATDRGWALIAPLLPAARCGGRPRSTCLRSVVNAVFYLLQTGCRWRMLPRDFPPRSTVYGYFRAWIAAGVWAHVHDLLYRRSRALEGRDESPTAAIIDSQSVRTGAEAREKVGFDAGSRPGRAAPGAGRSTSCCNTSAVRAGAPCRSWRM
jgi:transposase